MHLWEADHRYYCNEGNYYASGCGSNYATWAAFLANEGDSDMDYSLVFRWDWREGEDWGAGEYTGDDYYRNGKLLIFFMGQRKGQYRWVDIQVCRADEPAVREWLGPRWRHLRDLWEPLASVDRSPEGGDPKGLHAEHESAVLSDSEGDAQPTDPIDLSDPSHEH